MKASHEQAARRLRAVLRGRAAFLGVGNELREDDGVGPHFVSMLAPGEKTLCINCSTCPENYAGVVSRHRPDAVVIVDAVDFGGVPGETRVLEPECMAGACAFTHGASPALLLDHLARLTGARILILAFQPGLARFGHPLGEHMIHACNSLARELGSLA